jgi:hypothetical protein
MISKTQRSAMQAEPAVRSAFDTVPAPTIVPAPGLRVRAACATRSPKPKFIARPFGRRNGCVHG